MPLLRRIVFYVFVAIYLTSCPLTILYALGYLFTPGTERGFVKTGLMYVSTAPPGASIYLGKKRYTKHTPTALQGLLADQYALTLILKGYQLWSRIVSIEPEKATVLDKVLLLPNTLTEEELMTGPFDDLVPIPGTHFLLLFKGPKCGDILVYDWETKTGWPLISTNSPYYVSHVMAHVVVKDSPFVLFRVKLRGVERFLGIELRNNETRLTDLTSLFPNKPRWVEWDALRSHQLFSVQGNFVNRLDSKAMAIYPRIIEGFQGFGVGHDAVYVLTEGDVLQRVDREGRHVDTFSDTPVLGLSHVGGKGFFRITPLAEDLILLLGERGQLLGNHVPYQYVEEGVRGFEFDAPRERLLVWRKSELGILDVSSRNEEEAKSLEGPSLTWVFEEGKDIEQGFWVYDGSHILFRDRTAVSLLEVQTYGAPIRHPLVRARAGSSVAYSERSGMLYYVKPVTGALAAVEIVPHERAARYEQ